MNDLNLHHLAALCAVARHGSFTRAAEALYVGQPAVSQQVAALERALGVPLVQRAGRGVRLTEAGQLAVDYAERIFRMIDQLQAGLAGLTALTTGRLVVGAGQTPGDYLLPEVLGEFRRRHPGIAVDLEIADTRRVAEWLVRRVYDLGFVGDRLAHPALEVEPFADDQIVLFAPPEHPLANQTSVSLAAVIHAGLIVREPGSATRAAGEAAFRAAGVEPAPSLELGSNEAVKRAVLAGLGAGMLSSHAITIERQAGRLAPLTVPEFTCRRTLYIAWHRDTPLTAAQTAFRALAREMAARFRS